MNEDVSLRADNSHPEEQASGAPGAQPPPVQEASTMPVQVAAELDIDRVIDVPLSVTLRFGEREMRLREVMELTTGFLVELDRQIEEPVDLLLGERVIARGEVVIVDGNYGLRVTEVVHGAPITAR